MIVLVTGSTHTGKTKTAQKLLEEFHFPYLSIDHLKMGLIRSGNCSLSPESEDAQLQEYLWPIVREIIHTAIENKQNLIVEGCYIPFSYQEDFTKDELKNIYFICLSFSKTYIETHYDDILNYENCIEYRKHAHDITKAQLMKENEENQRLCGQYHCNLCQIDQRYDGIIDVIREGLRKYDTCSDEQRY